MYARILVPVDGSAASDRGLQEAIGLARACGSSLVLLHAVEFYPVMIEMATATTWELITNDLRQQGRTILEKAHRAVMDAGVAVESRLEEVGSGRVCDVVVAEARERHCDLIVMGTHGRRGLNRALIGSDAERVLHISPVPVLLVRAEAR